MRRRAGAAQEVPLQVSVKPIVSPIIASDMTLWSRFVVASFHLCLFTLRASRRPCLVQTLARLERYSSGAPDASEQAQVGSLISRECVGIRRPLGRSGAAQSDASLSLAAGLLGRQEPAIVMRLDENVPPRDFVNSTARVRPACAALHRDGPAPCPRWIHDD